MQVYSCFVDRRPRGPRDAKQPVDEVHGQLACIVPHLFVVFVFVVLHVFVWFIVFVVYVFVCIIPHLERPAMPTRVSLRPYRAVDMVTAVIMVMVMVTVMLMVLVVCPGHVMQYNMVYYNATQYSKYRRSSYRVCHTRTPTHAIPSWHKTSATSSMLHASLTSEPRVNVDNIRLVDKITERSRREGDPVSGTLDPMLRLSWVTEFSGKAPCREMRGFAGRERQPQSGALGTANQQPAP